MLSTNYNSARIGGQVLCLSCLPLYLHDLNDVWHLIGIQCMMIWQTKGWCLSHMVHAKPLQLCLTFGNPMDCSPLGSSVHGILQARTLERVAISFSTHTLYIDIICLVILHMCLPQICMFSSLSFEYSVPNLLFLPRSGPSVEMLLSFSLSKSNQFSEMHRR